MHPHDHHATADGQEAKEEPPRPRRGTCPQRGRCCLASLSQAASAAAQAAHAEGPRCALPLCRACSAAPAAARVVHVKEERGCRSAERGTQRSARQIGKCHPDPLCVRAQRGAVHANRTHCAPVTPHDRTPRAPLPRAASRGLGCRQAPVGAHRRQVALWSSACALGPANPSGPLSRTRGHVRAVFTHRAGLRSGGTCPAAPHDHARNPKTSAKLRSPPRLAQMRVHLHVCVSLTS